MQIVVVAFFLLSFLSMFFANVLPGNPILRQAGLLLALVLILLRKGRPFLRRQARNHHRNAVRARRAQMANPDLQLWKEFPRRCWALISVTVLLDIAAIVHGTDGDVATVAPILALASLFCFFRGQRTGIMASNIGTYRRSKEPIRFWAESAVCFFVYGFMSVMPLLKAFGKL